MNQLRSRTRTFKVFTGYRFHVLFDTSQIPQKQFKQVFWVLFLLDHLFSNAFACTSHAIVFLSQVGITLQENVLRIRQELFLTRARVRRERYYNESRFNYLLF